MGKQIPPEILSHALPWSSPLPATALRTNGNNTQTIVIPEFSGAAIAVTENIRNLRRKAGWLSHRSPGKFFHTLGSGQTRMPPVDRRREGGG